MSVQKSWYTHISNVNPQSGSDVIANWYNEADTKRNPYTYRDLPSDTVPFYLFLSEKLDTVIEDKQFYNKLMMTIKKSLKSEKLSYTNKIYTNLFEVQSQLYNAVTPVLYSDKEFKYTFNEYTEFFPFLVGQESSYVIFLDIDTYIYDLVKNFPVKQKDTPSRKLFTEIYDIYIVNNKSISERLANLSKISPSPQAQIAEILYEKYTNFINLTKLLIENELDKTWKGWKGLLDNLDKFPPGNKYEINTATTAGKAILDKKVLECFRGYIKSLPNEDRQEYFVYFLQNIVDALKQTSETNPGEFYDSYDLLTHPETEERLFYTYQFRHDFDKVKTSGITKSFSIKEIEEIDRCFYKSKKGFSAFITLLKEKHSKQEVVDSLTGIVIGCNFDPIEYPDLQAAPPPRANFTASANTTQAPVVPPYFEKGPAPLPKAEGEAKEEEGEEEESEGEGEGEGEGEPQLEPLNPPRSEGVSESAPENINKFKMQALKLLENSGTNIGNIQPLMNKIKATGQLSRNPELKEVYNLLNAKTVEIASGLGT